MQPFHGIIPCKEVVLLVHFTMGFLLLLSAFLTGQVLCQTMTPLCQEQDDELSACTDRLQTIISSPASLQTMCGEIEVYIKCHHGVGISCPDNPLLQEDAYRRSIEALKTQFNQRCPGGVSEVLCQYNVLHSHFLPKCYPLINLIQPLTPMDVHCSSSRQYLRCLERANAPCTNRERNLDRAISITKLELKARCPVDFRSNRASDDTPDSTEEELMQGDSPATDATTAENDEEDCSENKVGSRILACTRHILPTLGTTEMDSVHYCKYTRRYLRCVKKLMQRCSNAVIHKTTIYDPFKSGMVQNCEVNSERCPFDVMEGERNILQYCVGDNPPSDLGGPEYCRLLQAVPECLVRIKNRCQKRDGVTWDPDWLYTIYVTSNRYCPGEANNEERSTRDMEERSDLIGQSAYIDINDGDEVNQLQSAVNTLESLQ